MHGHRASSPPGLLLLPLLWTRRETGLLLLLLLLAVIITTVHHLQHGRIGGLSSSPGISDLGREQLVHLGKPETHCVQEIQERSSVPEERKWPFFTFPGRLGGDRGDRSGGAGIPEVRGKRKSRKTWAVRLDASGAGGGCCCSEGSTGLRRELWGLLRLAGLGRRRGGG